MSVSPIDKELAIREHRAASAALLSLCLQAQTDFASGSEQHSGFFVKTWLENKLAEHQKRDPNRRRERKARTHKPPMTRMVKRDGGLFTEVVPEAAPEENSEHP